MMQPVKRQDAEYVAEVMKVLGDKNRLHILSLLKKQELCVCEITALCHLSQSNVSQHLAKLRTAGLVKERRSAQWIYYSINESSFPLLADILKVLPEQDDEISMIRELKDHSECKT
jgi:ArsR family transcriptional regulator